MHWFTQPIISYLLVSVVRGGNIMSMDPTLYCRPTLREAFTDICSLGYKNHFLYYMFTLNWAPLDNPNDEVLSNLVTIERTPAETRKPRAAPDDPFTYVRDIVIPDTCPVAELEAGNAENYIIVDDRRRLFGWNPKIQDMMHEKEKLKRSRMREISQDKILHYYQPGREQFGFIVKNGAVTRLDLSDGSINEGPEFEWNDKLSTATHVRVDGKVDVVFFIPYFMIHVIAEEEGVMRQIDAYKWGGPRQTSRWPKPYFPTFKMTGNSEEVDGITDPPPSYEEAIRASAPQPPRSRGRLPLQPLETMGTLV